jgi:hypothetical protein
MYYLKPWKFSYIYISCKFYLKFISQFFFHANLIQKVKIISNLAFDFKMGNRKMARAFVHLNHSKTTSPHGSAVQAKK